MTNTNKLRKFRQKNNLLKPSGEIVEMLQEEINEVKVEVKAKNKIKLLAELADVIIIASNEIELMGYDVDKIVSEKISVISSRQQNPNQKEIWNKWGASGKWQKDKNQDASTLYVANYQGCKL